MLKELSDSCTLIRVQTWDLGARVPPALQDALAIEWPTAVGVVAASHTNRVAAVACLSPTEWLVIGTAAASDAATLLRPLQGSLEATPYRATTVTQALARIEVEGRAARLLLAKGCSPDLHPSRFSPGRCARTRLAGMPVILWCIQESTFQCIVASSYREYLLAWLADAGLEMEMTLS
jgi:sarcosine oxidase, subunit gamma